MNKQTNKTTKNTNTPFKKQNKTTTAATTKQKQKNQHQTNQPTKKTHLRTVPFPCKLSYCNSHESSCEIHTGSESGPEAPAIEYYVTNIRSLRCSIFVHKYNSAQIGEHFWLIILPTQHIRRNVNFA